ncbi:MAG: hypothetical protein LUD72_01595 [Bacteroidales bacterium]|nr:hypothetical protein [Bacteroidales bacterium]
MTINTEVSNLCFMIENAILKDMATQPVLSEDVMCQMERITVYYKCNAQGVLLNAGDAISGAPDVLVKYKVYILPQGSEDKDPITRVVQAECGCETDFEKGFIRIATWMMGKKMQKGFVSEIQHEANHYFQNFKGQEKNEGLYDRMVALFNAGDDYDREVCMSLYYSFTTEQDAFANQFYRYLMTNHLKKCIDYRTAMSLSIYPTFTSRVYGVEQFPNIFLNEILRDLGCPRVNIRDESTKPRDG